jgi:chromosome segregation ATPase
MGKLEQDVINALRDRIQSLHKRLDDITRENNSLREQLTLHATCEDCEELEELEKRLERAHDKLARANQNVSDQVTELKRIRVISDLHRDELLKIRGLWIRNTEQCYRRRLIEWLSTEWLSTERGATHHAAAAVLKALDEHE